MKHEDYDRHFYPATALAAEGARIALCTCRACGATVLLDPRDAANPLRAHAEWHDAIDAALASSASSQRHADDPGR